MRASKIVGLVLGALGASSACSSSPPATMPGVTLLTDGLGITHVYGDTPLLEDPAAGLEAIDATKGLQKNVLHDIGSIRRAADPIREPAMCPPHQRRQLAPEEQLYRRFASFSCAAPQVQGRPGRVRPDPVNRFGVR